MLRHRRPLNIWPAFVDATASLLMVVVFALLLAVIGQFVLATVLSSSNNTLAQLNIRVNELADMLSLEQSDKTRLKQLLSIRTMHLDKAQQQVLSQGQLISDNKALLAKSNKTLATQLETLTKLEIDILALNALRDRIQRELEEEITKHSAIKQKLQAESQLNLTNMAQIELINRQTLELRQQLSALAEILEVAKKESDNKKVKIDKLSERLNIALASKAQQLQKYRSEFFGSLREALSDYPDITIQGDRFVLPSGLLFKTGSDKLDIQGKRQVQKLAITLKKISKNIPDDINWILRIDGHTDKLPISISNTAFKSNWELSSARAISIIKEMRKHGIPARRMAATGFAEYHPVDKANTLAAYARNRRIELKLTSR